MPSMEHLIGLLATQLEKLKEEAWFSSYNLHYVCGKYHKIGKRVNSPLFEILAPM